MAGYGTYYTLAPIAVFRRAMKIARDWPKLCGMNQTEERMVKEVDYIKSEARSVLNPREFSCPCCEKLSVLPRT